MSARTIALNDTLYQYFFEHACKENAILQELREFTHTMPQAAMQISPEQGQFMGFLLRLMQAKTYLEIGTFTGYSSLIAALNTPDQAKIYALDISETFTNIAKTYWEKAGVSHKISLHLAPASETLHMFQANAQTFDFIFIDADKANYLDYFEAALTLLAPRGVIAVDNVLWYGKVADIEAQDKETNAIRALNTRISADNNLYHTLIPIGDGLSLVQKI